jgi:hypothetical protein
LCDAKATNTAVTHVALAGGALLNQGNINGDFTIRADARKFVVGIASDEPVTRPGAPFRTSTNCKTVSKGWLWRSFAMSIIEKW